MMKSFKSAIYLCAIASIFTACKKDSDNPGSPTPTIPSYTVPATYTFDNVEYTQASQAINMWQGFQVYAGRGVSRQLSQDTINYLWKNTNNAFTQELFGTSAFPFTPAGLNAAGFNLSDLTKNAPEIVAAATDAVLSSASNQIPAEEGKAGLVGTRLVNGKGLEPNQAVAKGLMGALVLAKLNEMLDKSTTADNTIFPGAASAMQHYFDMAFGYVYIPQNYDTAKSYATTDPWRPLAVGGYFGERGRHIKAGIKIFDAFKAGRAAIGAKDYVKRDAAIVTIKEFTEKAIAAAFYYYVTFPQGSTSKASQFHALSEGYGFHIALKYRAATSPLTAANYQKLADIMNTSFYSLVSDATFAKLKEAQKILTDTYGQLQP